MTVHKLLPAAIGLILPIAALTISPASAQSNAPKRHTHHIHRHVHHVKAPAAEKPAS